MSKLEIKMMFFDFDGTLTDSIPQAIKSIQAMLKKLNLPAKTAKEIKQYVGYGEIPLVLGAIGQENKKQLKLAMATYFSHYAKFGLYKIKLYPGIRQMLKHFSKQTKVIVSNKKEHFIRLILKNLKIDHYFQEIIGGDDPKCVKPDPCSINLLLKKYNCPKNQAIFVGDMTIDIETGKNAGIETCAVTYGFDPRQKLIKAKPDFLIDNIVQLRELISAD